MSRRRWVAAAARLTAAPTCGLLLLAAADTARPAPAQRLHIWTSPAATPADVAALQHRLEHTPGVTDVHLDPRQRIADELAGDVPDLDLELAATMLGDLLTITYTGHPASVRGELDQDPHVDTIHAPPNPARPASATPTWLGALGACALSAARTRPLRHRARHAGAPPTARLLLAAAILAPPIGIAAARLAIGAAHP